MTDLLGPRAHGDCIAKACLKASPSDFCVDEALGYDLSGEGEHVYCRVQKTGCNTEWVARQLARIAEVPIKQVSYAGLKDRNAVTCQWFSIHLPGKRELDLSVLNSDELKLIECVRHNKKLKRGGLKGNHFILRLTDFSGEKTEAEKRLSLIQSQGVPNYFAKQRFGHDGNNIKRAEALLLQGIKVKDKHKKGLYLSAARSWIFNLILAERVRQGLWNKALVGDVMMLSGSHSYFHAEDIDEALVQRVTQHDVSPAGPLWGRGRHEVSDKALAIELQALFDLDAWQRGVEQQGLNMAYRPFTCYPQGLTWHWDDENTLVLRFFLAAGQYATSVVRELSVLVSDL